MVLRFLVHVFLATGVGATVGVVAAVPWGAAGWGRVFPLLVLVGGAAGLLAGVLAVADSVGPFGGGSGQWLGVVLGVAIVAPLAALAAYIVVFERGADLPAREIAFLLGITPYGAGTGFLAGRYAERAARAAAGTE